MEMLEWLRPALHRPFFGTIRYVELNVTPLLAFQPPNERLRRSVIFRQTLPWSVTSLDFEDPLAAVKISAPGIDHHVGSHFITEYCP